MEFPSTAFEETGCCVLPGILPPDQLSQIQIEMEHVLRSQDRGVLSSRDAAYGVRNLLQLWPGVANLAAHTRLSKFLRDTIGDHFGVVRALFFDKPPGRSWTLPWHRDRTIAVRSHPVSLNKFRNPTQKAAIPHLVAPVEVLSRMLTLRFALDPMVDENGPLVVLPGSHHTAANEDEDLAGMREDIGTVHCQAGDVFAMRPLLAHSSQRSHASTRLRRRVIHLELCNQQILPEGVAWHEFRPIHLPQDCSRG